MGNSTPCKIVTHENLNMKFGIHDYVVDLTHHANFGWNRFSRGFSPNRWNITLLWLFWLSYFFLDPSYRSNCWADFYTEWLILNVQLLVYSIITVCTCVCVCVCVSAVGSISLVSASSVSLGVIQINDWLITQTHDRWVSAVHLMTNQSQDDSNFRCLLKTSVFTVLT